MVYFLLHVFPYVFRVFCSFACFFCGKSALPQGPIFFFFGGGVIKVVMVHLFGDPNREYVLATVPAAILNLQAKMKKSLRGFMGYSHLWGFRLLGL